MSQSRWDQTRAHKTRQPTERALTCIECRRALPKGRLCYCSDDCSAKSRARIRADLIKKSA